MAGRFVDLSAKHAQLPDLLVIDTNLIVEHLLYPWLGLPSSVAGQTQRAGAVFHHLRNAGGAGIVTPTVFQEFVHVAVRAHYGQARRQLGPVAQHIAAYGVPIRDWRDLYKCDATILQSFAPVLERFRQLLVANDLLVVAPEDLSEIESGRSFDAELVHLVGRYGLDSNDAVILMEAQRCGVTEIVTFDRDLLRAQADFTIYTWL